MANTSSAKGNPASHRMSNKNLQAKRERSWKNGQKRKEERKEEQRQREQRNKQLRAGGQLTPWEQSKARRREMRRQRV